MMKISRTMSTQHPDNVRSPFFSENKIIGGDEEIKEAFYAYSHLGIREQLWDFEGKDVDNSVVKKLLTRYETFFRKNQLGQDVFLTYRVPNPDIEKNEGKILLETLESIPRSFDAANVFYQNNTPPVFEVYVPMVTNAKCLIRIAEYYKKYVSGKGSSVLFNNDQPLSSWVGDFSPKKVRVTPLIEDKDSMLNAAKITEEYIRSQKVQDYMRVWLARSDPALNYSSFATVLIEKIALQRLEQLSEKLSLDIFPLLGCGSAPFRGNFKPTNVKENLKAYPSIQTFTLQSAFKYDYELDQVKNAIDILESTKAKKALVVDEETLLPIIEKVAAAYNEQIELLAPIINDFSRFVPSRRNRKLHIGLFGYSRCSNGGISLPRAIKFCASLYSLGLPPELLGLHVLSEQDIDKVLHAYPNFESDLKDAVQFFNKDNMHIFPEKIQEQVKLALRLVNVEFNREHQVISNIILNDFKKNRPELSENIERAASIRQFLG